VRASERLEWAADVVDPAPGERILEVDCEHGDLVALLAERLTTGVVVGIDRSPTRIAAATRRNRTAIEDGRVRLQTATLLDAQFGGLVFDVVVSFDVRTFSTPPAYEWDAVRQVLAPDGRVIIVYELVDAGSHRRIVARVRRLAGARGLGLFVVHRGPTLPVESVALELRSKAAG
jgi:SAM-dependent methyltransferase